MRRIRIGKDHSIPGAAVILAAVLLVIGLIIGNASAIHRQMDAWKLLPQPERLTELYFTDHAKLPTTYTPDGPQSFGFVVHNLEYRTVDYRYTLTAVSEDGSRSQDIGGGTIDRVTQDQYITRQINFTPQDLGRRVQIRVTLTYVSDKAVTESIHYWVTTTNAGEGA